MTDSQGRTLLIVNPAARRGAGEAAAPAVIEALRAAWGSAMLDVVSTQAAGHAFEAAEQAQGVYETVIALGGDGLIHEVANGLMQAVSTQRPMLGVIPVGTGNDYAQTLGMSTTVEQAVEQILGAEPQLMDVGQVNDEYFVETLSFGLDAAIGLETMERRQHSTKTGQALYFEAGINQLLHHFDSHHVRGRLDGKRTLGVDIFTFAVQIGPTYGGGFRICPDAQPDDGLFDICYAKAPVSLPRALVVFYRARTGDHVGMRNMRFEKASALELHFDAPPPAQADGERITGTDFDIRLHNHALRVLVPANNAPCATMNATNKMD